MWPLVFWQMVPGWMCEPGSHIPQLFGCGLMTSKSHFMLESVKLMCCIGRAGHLLGTIEAHEVVPRAALLCVMQEGFLADGAWLPQLGDQVVYIAEGHRKLLEQLNSDANRPWDSISADVVSLLRPSVTLQHPARDCNLLTRRQQIQSIAFPHTRPGLESCMKQDVQ